MTTSTTALSYGAKIKSANASLNIGITGTGDRGSGLIPFIDQIENFTVAACCDILPFRLQNGLSRTKDKAVAYTDYRKLLENKDLDTILVATPFNTHSKIATDAIDAGKHIYCEKTMAKVFAGIQHLVDVKNESNKIFQTGHQYHSSRLYTHVVDIIQNGKIGKITAFECQWNRNGNWRRSVEDPKLERLINWRMYREYSGGLVAELCSHQIDFVNWVLDATPIKVTVLGGVDYWEDGRETYDNIHLLYEYPKGIKAKFTSLTSNAMNDYKIKVLGDKGTIILDYNKAWFYPEGKENKELGNVDGVAGATVKWLEDRGMPIEVNHEDPSKQALIDFKDGIITNKQPVSNVISGAKAATCVQMGLDAMHNNNIMLAIHIESIVPIKICIDGKGF